MSIPVVTFFNNKGGVGKTSLAYHLAWMFSEMDHRILVVDLDPQANLTAAFLDEDVLVEIWEDHPELPNTIFRSLQPLLEVGDILEAKQVKIKANLSLIPGDLALSGFEDTLSGEWPESMGDKNLLRPFRVLTAFWQIMQQAAQKNEADLILVDVGPNLGAINRSALIASDFVIIPLGADLFSLQGLRNLGPTLRSWRALWKKRLENWGAPAFALPSGRMEPVGYIAQQHGVRLSRPVKAYDRWLNRMPLQYRQSVLGEEQATAAPAIGSDPECLALLKHFHSLVPMAMEARKPLFLLKTADGAIGAHLYAVHDAYDNYHELAGKILDRVLRVEA
ncbi:MAG: AAA family ATPase [Methylocystis sp.]|nr:AAA family ATPase [Methylocystis sp.]